MQKDIHPQSHEVSFKCSCGAVVKTLSTLTKDAQLIDVCSKCHPFYTGKQKLVDTGGRIHKFREKYGMQEKAGEGKTGDTAAAA